MTSWARDKRHTNASQQAHTRHMSSKAPPMRARQHRPTPTKRQSGADGARPAVLHSKHTATAISSGAAGPNTHAFSLPQEA